MTSLMRMLEEEKQQAIAEAVAQEKEKAATQLAQEKAKEAARLEKEKEETERGMARRMLSDGVPPRTVLQYSTLLSLRDIEALAGKS